MARSRLEFHGDEIRREIEAEMRRRLRRCALIVLNKWRELLNVDGTGVGPNGRLIYGANPSKPGEAPHKQRGRLLASTAFEIVGLVARIGSNLAYALILELYRDRPSLRPALKACQDEIRRILSAPMKGP